MGYQITERFNSESAGRSNELRNAKNEHHYYHFIIIIIIIIITIPEADFWKCIWYIKASSMGMRVLKKASPFLFMVDWVT